MGAAHQHIVTKVTCSPWCARNSAGAGLRATSSRKKLGRMAMQLPLSYGQLTAAAAPCAFLTEIKKTYPSDDR